MFMGLFGASVGVRLDDADRTKLLAKDGGLFGPSGRPMGGYVSLPAAWRTKPAHARPWVKKSFDYVGALPPKKPKPAKKK
jgi:hypothetical protein